MQFSSVQFSCSVVSDSLRPHELQHTRLPCPSPTPGSYTNSCLLSGWCHPTISSFVIPLFSCPQSFPASGSFPMSQFSQSCLTLSNPLHCSCLENPRDGWPWWAALYGVAQSWTRLKWLTAAAVLLIRWPKYWSFSFSWNWLHQAIVKCFGIILERQFPMQNWTKCICN